MAIKIITDSTVDIADKYIGNNNFEYDLIDIARQAISEKGRIVLKEIKSAYENNSFDLFSLKCDTFLNLILAQNRLLSCRKEFMVGNWINCAKKMGKSRNEKTLYEWNAKVQISTWGNRTASENGGLRDYAHKEWNGILKDLYYYRWKIYFDELKSGFKNKECKTFDWYSIDEEWINKKMRYPDKPTNNSLKIIKDISLLFSNLN